MQPLHSRTWLAVSGRSADGVNDVLGLRAGIKVTTPRRFALEGAMSDAGWYLVVADGRDHRLIQSPVLTKLSAGCEVCTCTVDERNLSSAATAWRDGHRLWSITYEGEESPGAVVTEGDLPASAAAISQALTAKAQAGDAGDFLLDPLFEIPIEVVRQAIGYRPDESSPAFNGRFVHLEAIDPTFLQRVFGG